MKKKTRNLFCGDLSRGLTIVGSILKEKPYDSNLNESEEIRGKSHKFRKESTHGFKLNELEKRCLEDTSSILNSLTIFIDKLKKGSPIKPFERDAFTLFPLFVLTYNSFRKTNKFSNFPIYPTEGFTYINELISNYLLDKNERSKSNNNKINSTYASKFFDKIIEEQKHNGLNHYEEAINILTEIYNS